MPKKETLDTMKKKLERYDNRIADTQKDLSEVTDKRNKLQAKIKAEEDKMRTHNLCNIGGIVYKYFGNNIAPEKFKEMLDYIFAISEVQEFVNSEKEKCTAIVLKQED